MKTVILSQRLAGFATEFEDLDHAGKVYLTRLHSPNHTDSETCFMTTSKDIHLELGRLSERLQWAIAMLISEELGNHGGTLLVKGREDASIAFMATLVRGDGLIIHLSRTTS
jgi:hypothetical protein